MGEFFTPFEIFVFLAFLVAAMAVGLIAGRKEETSEDYFLAGRKIPWWGVAGSIFGSNVSANHIVGMLGIGFSIGFAQSHFELGAIGGLMLLCYGFLPVYRKLRIYTLSEYLSKRYDERSRVSYAVIMVVIMAAVQMIPALYIGSRSICLLAGGGAVEEKPVERTDGEQGSATKLHVNHTYYAGFVIALAVISASYTIFGGLKAVVWTDVIQSVLMLAAAILVAVLTFNKLGGWEAMMAADLAGGDKMHLYLPMHHPKLPWTGVFTGLMFMHCFYWGTNQFIVQRALGARSDREARIGIIFAGFLKLLIPFFAVATGVASVYLFRQELPGQAIDPDAAFTELVKLTIPIGWGIIGVIAAGLIGAILSSIDSMMNSAATIVTIDIYKPYFNPRASDKELIFVGRISIVVFVVFAALVAIFVLNPNSEKNFFLTIVDYQNYLTPGILVTFILGMFWRRGTANASFVTIVAGVVFSALVVIGYDLGIGTSLEYDRAMELSQMEASDLKELASANERLEIERLQTPLPFVGPRLTFIRYLGPELNFFHRVVAVIGLCTILYVLVSFFEESDPKKGRLVWTDLGGHHPLTLRNIFMAMAVSLGVFIMLGWLMNREMIAPAVAAVVAAFWTLGMFAGSIFVSSMSAKETDEMDLLRDDRVWAGILCSAAVFMLYFYY